MFYWTSYIHVQNLLLTHAQIADITPSFCAGSKKSSAFCKFAHIKMLPNCASFVYGKICSYASHAEVVLYTTM